MPRRCYDIPEVRICVQSDRSRFLDHVDATLNGLACPDLSASRPDASSYSFVLRQSACTADLTAPDLPLAGKARLPNGLPVETYILGERRSVILPSLARIDFDGNRRELIGRVSHHHSALGLRHALLFGLIFALEHSGQAVLHAASMRVSSDRDASAAIIILGDSGTGKTTTALKLVESGMTLLSDDTSVLFRKDGVLGVWGFPRPCKVHENSLDILPWLRPFVSDAPCDPQESWVELPADRHLPSTSTAVPAMLVFLDRRNPDTHQITPASRIDALLRLTQSHVQARIPERGKGKFALVAELARSVPAFRCSVGPTLAGIEDPILRLLRPT